ncbi:MAG TPA: TetR family transcriptional regulator [Solirubrobacterales bacterium]
MPRTRNPDLKRANLLQAGLEEFSRRGLNGTPVEDIAKAAGCSTGLIYSYFGSKDGLFDAVMESIVQGSVDEVPFTPDDLPGYAGRLFDDHMTHPEILRFVGWYRLERSPTEAAGGASDAATKKKIKLLRAAQKDGRVASSLDPGELVLTVQAIALMWFSLPPEVGDAIHSPKATKRRRSAVVDAVRRVLAD